MNTIIFREWFSNRLYPLLFSLCIIISIAAFLTLDALQQSVNSYIEDNQKQVVGGDIVIDHNQAFPDDLINRINQLDKQNVVFDYQFNAITYTKTKSLLTRIKAVDPTYPLYGDLILANNQSQWLPGSVLVEQQVLSNLNIVIGDSIQIGDASFVIHDEIITEPDRPLTAFGFGSRVIMHQVDLDKTALIGKRSRVSYRIELKVNPISIEPLLKELLTLTENTKITVETSEQANTSISNLSINFLIFLKLLVVAVIILSGIGIMSIVKAFVAKQQNTNAIRISLGEKSQTIIHSFRLLFSFMTLIAVLMSWLLSLLVLHLGEDIFSAILPHNVKLGLVWFSLLKAFVIALSLTLITTHFTLNKISNIKPIAVLHKHQQKPDYANMPWLWLIISSLAVVLLLYSELDSFTRSLQIFIGLVCIWLVFALLTRLLMVLIKWALNKKLIKNWKTQLALQNIFRKGNQSNLFITTLSMASMILASISILDYSIQQQLISTYPDDAPNFFLLDVQTDQQQQLNEIMNTELTYYPVIRARINSVNGINSDVLKPTLGQYDNITRMFNLSYADDILDTEELIASTSSEQLFSVTDQGFVAVSILNSFAEYLQVELGDKVVFNVQGIKIKAEITSVRKRLKRGPSPFFYFVFPPKVMADAPQIRFATAQIADDRKIELQTRVAQTFPGITTLDGARIAKKLKGFVDQLKQLVQIFTALSLFAGLMIFATSLVSTSQDRLRESFYYRMMGMLGKDLLKLSIIEFLFLGLFAFSLGVFVASIISWLITTYWFSLSFIFPWSLYASSTAVLTMLLLLISFIYNHHVKGTNVIDYLRKA